MPAIVVALTISQVQRRRQISFRLVVLVLSAVLVVDLLLWQSGRHESRAPTTS